MASLSKIPPPPWTSFGSWRRRTFLLVLFLVTTSNWFDYFILSVVLDPIKREFGVSDSLLGSLGGIGFALVYAVAALPLARWADRGNRRTVIAVALAGWSAMTTLCGLATSFRQLALARLGVAALEPGAAPSAQSLVMDYFPPAHRPMAIAVLTMGASAMGYLSAVALGGQVAEQFGWRSAFLMAGLPGLGLALVVRLVLAEPRLRLGFPQERRRPESTFKSIRALARKRSFTFALTGQALCTVFAAAVSIFLPSFMIRSLHASLGEVSQSWGFAVAIADLAGGLLGGWLTDRLSRRDVRWYAWLPALASAIALPVYALALTTGRLGSFVAVDCIAEVILSVGFPPVFSAVHAVCGDDRRAVAIATLQLTFYFVGIGLGPSIAGMISDAYSAGFGMDSLRYSLLTMCGFLLPAALMFYAAGRSLPNEVESS